MADRLVLPQEHRRTLEALFREHLPDVEVWAYGSRVNGRCHPASDLDLVLRAPGSKKIPADQLASFADAVCESTIPFLVEARDWSRLPESFRREIKRNHAPLDAPADSEPALSKWPTATIGEVAEKVGMGPFGSSIKVETFVAEGVPIISGQHLHGSRLDDSPGYNFITEAHARRLANANVQRGDVLFTHAGNIGQTAYIPDQSRFDRYVISQRQFYMRCDRSKVIPEFVVAYFRSPEGRHKLLANASQVGVPSIAQPVSYLRTIDIPLPSLAEQRAIAHILGTLDDKIELNRRMNLTLEAMGRALFKSWFVDFDPLPAKMEQRDIGLTDDAAQIFPDALDVSAHCIVPRRWKVVELTELIYVNPRRPTLRKRENAPYLPMSSMPKKGHTPSEVFERPFESGTRFINGDTLLARITPCLENGKTAYVDFLEDGQVGWGSTEYIVLRPKPVLPTTFAYFLSRSPSFRDFAINSMTGTSGRQRVQPDALGHFLLPRPSEQIAKEFGRLTRPLVHRARTSANESQVLAELRHALLPKLLSAKLSVQQAEKTVAEVL